MGPVVVVAGVSVSVLKVYRPQLWAAWVFYIIGTGVFMTMRADTALSQGIGWPILMGAGSGILYGMLLLHPSAPWATDVSRHVAYVSCDLFPCPISFACIQERACARILCVLSLFRWGALSIHLILSARPV